MKSILEESKAMRLWNIIYPIAIYYVVTTVTLFILDFILPETADSKLLRQLITSVVAIPFLYSFYSPRIKFKLSADKIKKCILIFIMGGCFAIAWNNVLGMIKIEEYSATYEQVEATFYMGKLFLEILALCVVIPIVEELLYRGIVYGRIRQWLGVKVAIIASAVIFGLIHMNLVQFVYATVFGLLLAWFVEVTGDISGAIAAHMAANLTSVLRAETNIFSFLKSSMGVQVFITVVFFIVCGVMFWLLKRSFIKNQ